MPRPADLKPLLLGLPLLLAGCAQHLDRRETMTLWSGDAASANAAIHTVDPWPRGSERVDHETNGVVVARGVQRYLTDRTIRPQGLSSSSVVPPGGPAAGAPAGPGAPGQP